MKKSELEERIKVLEGRINMLREECSSLDTIVNDILERVGTLEDKQNELEEKLNKKINVYDIYMCSFDKDIDIISQRVDKLEGKDEPINNLKIGDNVFICFDGKGFSSCSSTPSFDMINCNHKIGGVIGFYNGEVKVRVGLDKIFFINPECVIKVEE